MSQHIMNSLLSWVCTGWPIFKIIVISILIIIPYVNSMSPLQRQAQSLDESTTSWAIECASRHNKNTFYQSKESNICI